MRFHALAPSHWAIAALLTCVVLTPPDAGAQADGRTVAAVRALVASYDSGWNRRDTARVGSLLAPGYRYFTSRGGVTSRAGTISFLGSPEYVLDRAERSELAVALGGPVAVVSSRWRGQGTFRGERFTDDQRCGQVWLSAGRSWQLLSEHCVQIEPSPRSSHQLPLDVLPDTLAICRLPPGAAVPAWASAQVPFLTISRTSEELSITTLQSTVPSGVRCERDYRALRVRGVLPTNLVGILVSIAEPLARAGLSIFAISTYDTDYVLLKSGDLPAALEVLRTAGHTFE